jgi:DNA primase
MRVLSIPEGKDPDEFVKNNGPDKFLNLIKNAVTLVEYKASSYKKVINIETIEGKIEFLDKLAAVLAKVDNHIEREVYVKRFARQYDISEEAMEFEISRKDGTKKPKIRVAAPRNSETLQAHEILSEDLEKISHDEKMILALLCAENDVYKRLKTVLNVEFFQFQSHKDLAVKIFNLIENNNEITIDGLFDMVTEDEHNDYAKIIYSECNCEDNFKAIMDLIKRIELARTSYRKKEILEELSCSSITKEEREVLNKELRNIMIRKR